MTGLTNTSLLPPRQSAATDHDPPVHKLRQTARRFARFGGDVLIPGIIRVALWAWAIFNILLLAWVVSTSLRPTHDILANPFGLPTKVDLSNYTTAWTTSGFGPAAISTLIFVSGTLVLTMCVAIPAAYALARRTDRTASRWSTYFAMGLSLPMQTVLVPFFVINTAVGQFFVDWVTGFWDPRISLIVFYAATSVPWAVFVLTSYFRSLPVSLEEAAQLDGASRWKIFSRIMLPMGRGPILTVSLITGIGAWNETLMVLFIVPDSTKRTLPAALLNMYYSLQYTSNWGALFAGIVLLVGPIILIFLWLGHRIIEGVALGAEK